MTDPRRSNHGGHIPHAVGRVAALQDGGTCRFDWYEMTADGLDDGRCAPALAIALGAEVRAGKGRNGYGRAEVVERGGDVLATVYGGSARAGEVHIVTTGLACDEVVPVVRRLWPEHRVSRADSALDFRADFELLDRVALKFAETRGLRHSLFTSSDGGATRYVGSPRSEGMARLYKKSEQLRAMHPEVAAEVPSFVVRAEFVARPGKRAAKEALARMEPADVWGLAGWSQEFAALVLELDPVRTSTHFRRPSDWWRSMHFLGVQYAPMVQKRAGEEGAEAVAAEVLAHLGFGPAQVTFG